MRKLFALCTATALTVLGLVGIGATATSAQAAPEEIKISEVLINTAPDANPTGTKISGVEVVKPSGAGTSIQDYRIQACDRDGNLINVATIDNSEENFNRTAASDQADEYEYNFAPGASMDRLGGVRLIKPNGDVVDAVTFNPANALVADCLTGSPTGNPDVAPAPTDVTSSQRLCDTGPWVLAEPTFGGANVCY